MHTPAGIHKNSGFSRTARSSKTGLSSNTPGRLFQYIFEPRSNDFFIKPLIFIECLLNVIKLFYKTFFYRIIDFWIQPFHIHSKNTYIVLIKKFVILDEKFFYRQQIMCRVKSHIKLNFLGKIYRKLILNFFDIFCDVIKTAVSISLFPK